MKLLICTQKIDKDDPILGFFHRWVEEFAAHGEQVHVVCLEMGEHELPPNVSVHSLGKERREYQVSSIWHKVLFAFRFFRYIVRLRKEYDAVLVHMNPEYVVLGGLLWRLWKKRIGLWYVHQSVTFKLRIATSLSHIVFTASALSFRIPSRKIKVVGHGIELISPIKHNPPLGSVVKLVSIGRLSPIKSYETVIEAVKMLRQQDVPVTLDVYGGPLSKEDDQYERELRRRVEGETVADTVKFHGPVSHAKIPDILQNADFLVSDSGTGSIDKVVLEAMAYGAIPIASNEAFRELFGGLSDRLMFEAHDAESLAKRIAVLRDAHDRELLAHRLRCIVEERHSLKKLVPAVLNLLAFPQRT